jgi:hypothetical protein
MANKKRHINSEAELLHAMRITGYCFPLNATEQRLSLKLQPEFNIEELSKAIDADEIWHADVPRAYKRSTVVRELKSDDEIAKEWGIAARGNANISKEILDKIKKNQAGKKDNG